ncbi:MAG: hypothetical protein M3471_05120 [Actinomycetota bacterium]|nr:hypothetical protein [Actinomycetota bacterium]
MDDNELGRLLANQVEAPEPSAESLRAIVARDRRMRLRTFAAAVATTLAVGVVIGGNRPEPDPAQGQSTEVASADLELASFESDQLAALDAVAVDPGQDAPSGRDSIRPEPLDQLFLRTTGDGVAVRAYRHQVVGRAPCPEGQECPPSPPVECLPSELLLAELSNSGSIGPRHPLPVFTEPQGRDLDLLHSGVFGGRERSPAQWVAVLTGPDVALVRATFAGGSVDEMAPVDGYSVLARGIDLSDVPAGGADAPLRLRLAVTVESLDASGSVVGSDEFVPGATFSRPEGCPAPLRGERGGPRHGRVPGGDAYPRAAPGSSPPGNGPEPGPGATDGPDQRPGGRPRLGPGGHGDGPGPVDGDLSPTSSRP